jgi:hypothetical protein
MSVTFSPEGDYDFVYANFSNVNAKALLELLDMEPYNDDGLCGTIPHNQIADVRRRIVRARNTDRSQAITPTSVSYGLQGACFVEIGSTDEQVLNRLTVLDTVLDFAQTNGCAVYWG